jgi:hypothetical protein
MKDFNFLGKINFSEEIKTSGVSPDQIHFNVIKYLQFVDEKKYLEMIFQEYDKLYKKSKPFGGSENYEENIKNLDERFKKLEKDSKKIPQKFTSLDKYEGGREDKYNKDQVKKYETLLLLDEEFVYHEYANKERDKVEIADLYDKTHNTFYHIKKKNDMRTICFQVINGCLILRDKSKFNSIKDYFRKYITKDEEQMKEILKNFSFVFGIIMINDVDISPIYKKDIAIACRELDTFGVKTYLQKIYESEESKIKRKEESKIKRNDKKNKSEIKN